MDSDFMLFQLQAVLDVMLAVNIDNGTEADQTALYGDLSKAVRLAAERAWPGRGSRAYDLTIETGEPLVWCLTTVEENDAEADDGGDAANEDLDLRVGQGCAPDGERDQLDYEWNEPGAPFRSSDY